MSEEISESESEVRPEEVTNENVSARVHERLHGRDGTSAVHSVGGCWSYSLDTVVWETLALIGEWDLIIVEPQNDAARKALGC
jgi:hypothetical protein